MKSVVTYPNRGHYGSSSWRGNTTGHIIVDLINHFRPKYFVDVCEGSGTSKDVCNELNIQYTGLDLHKGNDFTTDYVLNQLLRPADMVWSHPPYFDMIRYSGNVWGKHELDNDTSMCRSVDEFLYKSQVMLLNQREATVKNGIYTTLIGDQRKNGEYFSYQADFIKMMPKDELKSVVIKLQHNCLSDNKKYANTNFIPILHEYLLVWQKKDKSIFQISFEKAIEYKNDLAATWRSAIRIAFMRIGNIASLDQIYTEVEKVAYNLIKNNQHWKAKIRQTLQKHYNNVNRGVWAI